MSCRAYAKRRGVSAMAVSVAIRDGRLVKSVIRDQFGVPKIGNPDLADQEWEANTDHIKRIYAAGLSSLDRPAPAAAPPDARASTVIIDAEPPRRGRPPKVDGDETIASATERLKSAQANLAELKFRQTAGELVEAAAVEREWADLLSQVRTKLLAIPSRVKQQIPALSVADVATVETLVREALEDLVSAEGEAT